MNFPAELKYTKDHEWIRVEENTGTIGVTEYAQGELGDVVFVDIDPNISVLTNGSTFGTIEAVKTVSELYAPCNGKVLEINNELNNEPELVNKDPYGKGWMIKISIENLSELDSLLSAEDYKSLIGQ